MEVADRRDDEEASHAASAEFAALTRELRSATGLRGARSPTR